MWTMSFWVAGLLLCISKASISHDRGLQWPFHSQWKNELDCSRPGSSQFLCSVWSHKWWTSLGSNFIHWSRKCHKVCTCLAFNSHPYRVNLSLLKIKVVSSQVAKLLCFGLNRSLRRELWGDGRWAVYSQNWCVSIRVQQTTYWAVELGWLRTEWFGSVSSEVKASGCLSRQEWEWALGCSQILDTNIFMNLHKQESSSIPPNDHC